MSYNTKNYTEQGGGKTVIGGTLEVSPDGKLVLEGGLEIPDGGKATVNGDLVIAPNGTLLFGEAEVKPATGQGDSEATTIALLKDDFNALLQALYTAGLMVADKSELVEDILEALILLDEAVVGEEPGEYPEAAYDTFSAAVDAARVVSDNGAASQTIVDGAVTTLAAAVAVFEAAVIPEEEI